MHTRNFIFICFRLLNLRGGVGDRPHRPPGYATDYPYCLIPRKGFKSVGLLAYNQFAFLMTRYNKSNYVLLLWLHKKYSNEM